ncbi:MAG: hypothetical protein IJ011_01650 [Clostridia bacterium]|nr:hypothetical protein [Clostridia bacterium]
MYELRPAKTNNKAQRIIFLFFAGAAALLFVTVPLKGMPFIWVIQLLAILLLVAAVFLVTRYVTKGYVYTVADADGNGAPDLTVTEVSAGGKKQLTVCRVSLSSIEKAIAIGANDGTLKDLRKEKKRIFDYRPDIEPEKSILAFSNEGGEEIVLLLAFDEGLLRTLRG